MQIRKASRGAVEEAGITALKLFLHGSSISTEHIRSGDTYPSWDGELIVYDKQDSHRQNENIVGRIPIQVKAAKKKAKEKETWPIWSLYENRRRPHPQNERV